MPNANQLVFQRRSFKELAEILDIVNTSSVPIEELHIAGCTWDYDNNGLWSKCLKRIGRERDCPYGCPVPAPPSSLQLANINVVPTGHQAHPLSLALWLAHSRTPSLIVKWSFQFTPFHARNDKNAQILKVLGSRLAEVSFGAVGPRNWDNHLQDLAFPDLSHNTELKTLNLMDVIPELCPPNYLASVVSKVSASTLETLFIRCQIRDNTHIGLKCFDLKALGEALRPDGFPKYPQLRTLTFCLYLKKGLAIQEATVPPDVMLQEKIYKELPFLRTWQEGFGLRVNILMKVAH